VGRPGSALARVFSQPTGDPYAGADRDNAARLGALVWLIGAVVGVALLPVSPPTSALGSSGWVIAGVNLLVAFVGARQLVRGPPPGFDLLYTLSFLGVLQIALLEWLAGGRGTPYHQLYLLAAIYAGGIHPPRRVLVFLLTIAVAAFTPLLYDGWDPVAAADIGAQLLIIFGVTLLTAVLMARVRAQRVSLRDDTEFAKKLAHVDALTGLGNRRAFDEALEREAARAGRSSDSLFLLLGDINDFKQINDAAGHSAGDRSLRQVASAINDTVRRADACFRWGGDEFAVLLAQAGADEARWIARRLEASVSQLCNRPDGSSVAITWGLCEFEPGMNTELFVERADEALLGRKHERHEGLRSAPARAG
jgi:diguanylate cyclase (GGDEF)-like protein